MNSKITTLQLGVIYLITHEHMNKDYALVIFLKDALVLSSLQ